MNICLDVIRAEGLVLILLSLLRRYQSIHYKTWVDSQVQILLDSTSNCRLYVQRPLQSSQDTPTTVPTFQSSDINSLASATIQNLTLTPFLEAPGSNTPQ
ncbi:hypothetical protein TWF506_001162 [Arthrobotrys conoides]|uniref:Uncharacterized protein n=1 Tax=Arthrobotrys conoides TaxID=74498 RepID=A0AAN8NSP8_9PEZI